MCLKITFVGVKSQFFLDMVGYRIFLVMGRATRQGSLMPHFHLVVGNFKIGGTAEVGYYLFPQETEVSRNLSRQSTWIECKMQW